MTHTCPVSSIRERQDKYLEESEISKCTQDIWHWSAWSTAMTQGA